MGFLGHVLSPLHIPWLKSGVTGIRIARHPCRNTAICGFIVHTKALFREDAT